MADKDGKRKAKARREKANVLGNLPATRPQRLGRPRTDTPAVSEEAPVAPPPERPKRPPRAKPAVGPARVQATPASGRARLAAAVEAADAEAAAEQPAAV